MIGSFLIRGLVMVFGYAYPAYECYKTVEKNKPEVEQLRFWCQYWILVAILTVSERIGDAFISWVPMYSEAKLAFFIYLWYPKTKGTTYVYDSFFKPYVAQHESEIDRNLLELRTRAGDMVFNFWQRAASYGQTRIFEILQYIASQSPPTPSPAQRPQQNARTRQPAGAPNRQTSTGPTRQPAAAPSPQSSTSSQSENVEPPSSASNASSSGKQEVAEEVGPRSAPGTEVNSSAPVPAAQNATAASDPTNKSLPREADAMEIHAMPSSTSDNANAPPSKETLMEETIRMTRGRLRRTRTGGSH